MQAKKLRKLLNEPGIICAPGAYDAWSARLVEMAGFPAVYMTGYGVSVTSIGLPDIGLVSMTEMALHAKNMASAVDRPLIADGDNGYGGVLNVVRTVQEYEKGGVAAIQLEDQVLPKRCGHMEGKQLIAKEEMVAKVRAAVHGRKSPDFVIIARTDARGVNGFDDAIDRARAYAAAGADVIFVEAPKSVEEMKEVTRRVNKPLMANMVEQGQTPFLAAKELEELGYKIVIYPASTLFTASKAMIKMLQLLKEKGTNAGMWDDIIGFPEFNKLLKVDEMRALEKELAGN
ncbi:MAG: isocitrate lyase/phosphoenolpyruvate mutase family protein [Firmicutes bacterium]|nr:isocitrate lyase/phosphoenolpyruvate mutase family protein [Bacillota bacterium]